MLKYIYSFCESFDNDPTSLVYMDTTVNPPKILGKLQVYKFEERKNSVEFYDGKFLFMVHQACLKIIKSTLKILDTYFI